MTARAERGSDEVAVKLQGVFGMRLKFIPLIAAAVILMGSPAAIACIWTNASNGTKGIQSNPSAATAPFPSGPAWTACQSDSECVLVAGSSCFHEVTINRKYLLNYKSFRDDFESRAECERPPPDDLNAVTKCVEEKCTIAVPGNSN